MADVSFGRVDSRSELQERLRRIARSVLLGGNAEAAKEFFLALIPSGAIGVCSQGHGPLPAGLVDEQHDEIWVGFNSKLANVSLRRCHEQFVLTLDGVFHAMLSTMHDGSVIVIYELGACRVGRDGRLIWNRATDVVTDFSDEGDSVRLQTDEEEIWIDKRSGQSER